MGKVVVALDSGLKGAAVELNGAPLAPERVGVPAAVLPGSVSVAAVGSDGTRVEQSITVAAGEVATVTLSARADGSATEPPETAEGGGFGVVRGLGIGVTLLGAGGFVAFAVGSIIADDKLATLDSSCGAGPCTDPAMSTVKDEGQTAEMVAFIGLGVGIAGMLGGVAMIIWGGDDGEEAVVSAGPGSVTMRLRF